MSVPPYLCTPTTANVPKRFFMFTQAWTPNGLRWDTDPGSNRLDIARSYLLDRAMSQGRPCWQWDSDVVAYNQSFEEMLSLIEETLRKGYDAVIAAHSDGQRMAVQALPGEEVPKRPTEPFEVLGGFNGMWFMSLRGLAKLEPIGWHEFADGTKVPLFCTFGLPSPVESRPTYALTEDFDLAVRFRAAGGRIACDPRLKVDHMARRDVVTDLDAMKKLWAQQDEYEAMIKAKGVKHVGRG